MDDEKDRGQGNEDMFPADDLERLYRKGGLEIAARIRGRQLNEILGVNRYRVDAWYVVTDRGVKKL